jgi:hypothetical protein
MPDDRLMPPDARLAPADLRRIGFGLLGLVLPGDGGPDMPPEEAFLRQAAGRIGSVGAARAALDALLRAPPDTPLFRMAAGLELSPAELVATQLSLAVETDAMVGRAMAYLQAPIGGSRPTLGLLAGVLGPLDPAAGSVAALAAGPAVRAGLLRLSENGPLPERHVSMAEGLTGCLTGTGLAWPGLRRLAPAPDPDWPQSLREAVAPIAQGLARNGAHLLIMRGVSPPDRLEVSARMAAALGRQAAHFELDKIDPRGIGAFCQAAALMPAFEAEVSPGDYKSLPDLAGYAGAAIVFMGPEGALGHNDFNVTEWRLPLPRDDERAQMWRSAFADEALCSHLGREHLQSAGRINEICRFARAEAALQGKPAADLDTLRAAIWSSDSGGLGALAQPIKDVIPDDAMIASPALTRDLGFLLARCRAREKLTEGLGGALLARYKVGVRSLFAGPSGTGKTLAAAWLSGKLHLPLYRVDLAAVSSKYIGETEKNLSQLLAKAEEQDIVLLFDEADSLFGKRTDISDSNDRFANAQTNYLLQRIETFSGIVLLTSNAKNRFDEAFTRRIDAIVDFTQPEAEERIGLWRAHLGTAHQISGLELNRLAAFADITGGHIRNVVLMAAVLARGSGGVITYAHLLDGLKSEYRKLGLTVPSELMIVRGVA